MKVHCSYDALVKASTLNPHPKNRNKHPDDQIKRLASILSYQGWRYPVKVSKQSGYVTSGHGRILAAKLNKWAEVPVNYQDYDDDAQEYADVQADNAIASWSELDLSGINSDIGDLGPDFEIDLLGIKNFTIEVADKDLGDPDDVPEVPEEPKTKFGDVYRLGAHRLMCGDSTSIDAVEKLMGGEKADMVFTDPPYNIGYGGTMSRTTKNGVQVKHETACSKYDAINNDSMTPEQFEDFMHQVMANIRLSCTGAWYICFGSQTLDQLLTPLRKADMDWKSILIWMKNQSTISGKDFKSRYEPIVYGRFNDAFYGERYNEEDIWEVQRTLKNDLHPTMKPVALIERALGNSSKLGQSVLDLFGGSGSTLIACEKTNRKCFMMELDPHYCDVIVARWEKYTGKNAELIDG